MPSMEPSHNALCTCEDVADILVGHRAAVLGVAAVDRQVAVADGIVEMLQERAYVVFNGARADLHPDIAGSDGVAGEEFVFDHVADGTSRMANNVDDLERLIA